MSSTTQRHALPAWTTTLESLHAFARLPTWLERAAHPEHVADALRNSIPEFTSGRLTLQACRVKHLLLSADGAGWSGTYQCSIAEPPLTEQPSVALLGILIPPHLAIHDELRTSAPFASDAWRWFVPELRVAFQMQPADTQLDVLTELTNPEHARALLERCMEQIGHSSLQPRIVACQPQVLRYHPGLRCTIGYHLTYQGDASDRPAWPPFVVAKTYDDERGQNAYEVLLDQGRIGFIDFDSFCQAEPAMDLALFMVSIVDIGLRTLTTLHPSVANDLLPGVREDQVAQLEAIADRFLAAYATLRPITRQRVVLWQALNTLELVARSWDRVKPPRLTHTIAMLERQLRVLGGEAYTTLQ